MTLPTSANSRGLWIRRGAFAAGAIAILCVAWFTRGMWWPAAQARFDHWLTGEKAVAAEDGHDDHAGDDHAGHDHSGHDHAGHDESTSLHLSEQARRNIGLRVGEVELRAFQRSITVPAMVVERPGRTMVKIAAPMNGVVTGVHVAEGEAVHSGDLLFELRLTHEDLVEAQTAYLRTLGQLEVEKKELERIEKIPSGAVAGRVLLERQYEVDKLQVTLDAEREALLLHGLSEEQVARITKNAKDTDNAKKRKLIREVTITVPLVHEDASLHSETEEHSSANEEETSPESESTPHAISQRFVVAEMKVRKGSAVQAGETLCVLGDFRELYIEGRAFEQDADELIYVANSGRSVWAIPEDEEEESQPIGPLEISHVANEVELDSRALNFYVPLPNSIVRDAERDDGRHFLTWRFKIGQRMEIRLPVERWENVLVLPVDAVAQEGPESFVFVENGDHFDRRPVHVEFRDRYEAVIANDGSLFPGDTVALSNAHQLQMAIKNKAGGGVDPHAGHHH